MRWWGDEIRDSVRWWGDEIRDSVRWWGDEIRDSDIYWISSFSLDCTCYLSYMTSYRD